MKRLILLLIFLANCISIQNEFRFKAPLQKGKITSNLGGRWGKMHYGVDIGAPKWTPVKTTARGKVVAIIKHDKVFGNRVDIYHKEVGLFSSYSHLQEISVEVSQDVNDGDVIGLVGSTGKSTGYHLHFEIYNSSGAYINPLSLIENHNFVEKKK